MPPLTITLFEHQSRSYADMGLFPADPARRDRVLAKIERINERAGQEILHLGRNGLRANALVGVVSTGDIVFEILPKIDAPPSLSPVPGGPLQRPGVSASANLMALLSYAYGLRIYEQEIAGLDTQPAAWLELLTRLLATGLRREILAGLPQQYVDRQESLSVLRGRWDIQHQLRRPGRETSGFDVIYDDLSPDFSLNQVFRFVIEQLRDISRDPANQALLADLSAWFQPVTLLSQITPELLENIQFNRLNERFQPAFHLARMFLSGSAIQLSAGNTSACAFVFDMNVLFERFVAGFLTRYHREILPPAWQDISILRQSAGAAWYLGRSGGKNLLRLRPDLLFMPKGQTTPLLAVDTKYKTLDAHGHGSGASTEDIYQVLAYAVRLKCPLGLLLYPQTSPDPIRRQIEIDSANFRLGIATLNLRVPLSQPSALVAEFHHLLQILL